MRAIWLWCLMAAALIAAQPPSVLLEVPFVPQEKNGCGAASIAMVMGYWHMQQPSGSAPPQAADIQRLLYSPRLRGIPASGMIGYFEQHGFRTFAIEGEWSDIEQNLSKGRPVIVALKPGRGDLHYVVLTGLESMQDLVIKHDPADRKWVKQHRKQFEREWKAAGRWLLLALPQHSGN
jgi:ABC-type bacteriocin/lantibiotic exporter with double-glycine peptidase domain